MTRTALVLAASLVVACLPEDTRPPPGRLVVTVEPDSTLQSGFVTANGWEITFDQFLVALGQVRTEPCESYAEVGASYTRILNLVRPEAQTVATVYALGQCRVGFQLARPDAEVLLGEGVDETDAQKLADGAAAVLSIAGTAMRSGDPHRFTYTSDRAFDYGDCATVELRGGDTQTFELQIRGAELFRDPSSAELRFDPVEVVTALTPRLLHPSDECAIHALP